MSTVPSTEYLSGTHPRSNWNLDVLVFLGEKKTGVPGEKPLGARTRTNNKLNPHITPGPGDEPGPHWWEASALTTTPPLRHPYSPKINKRNKLQSDLGLFA